MDLEQKFYKHEICDPQKKDQGSAVCVGSREDKTT